MKKILGFIIDVLLIAAAWIATDVVMYNLQSEDLVIEFFVFLGFSLVLEGLHWLITRPFSKKQ